MARYQVFNRPLKIINNAACARMQNLLGFMFAANYGFRRKARRSRSERRPGK